MTGRAATWRRLHATKTDLGGRLSLKAMSRATEVDGGSSQLRLRAGITTVKDRVVLDVSWE
jgi:hypothetical protein